MLPALDGAFLDIDTSDAPLHVGWTIRIDGPSPGVHALRRHLTRRLDRVPAFRRRIVATALAGGERRFEDDPVFDIARHVETCTVAAPGGPGELRVLAGRLLSVPLDSARPLWRMVLVEGLAGGGWALVGQAHHVLVDGIAAMQVAALLLDVEPHPAPDAPSSWAPRRTPPVRAARAVASARAREATGALRMLGRAAGHAVRSAGDAPGGVLALGEALDALLRPAASTALDDGSGTDRAVAFAEVGLEAVREAGRRHGATVNDVLLAASTVALRPALGRRGESLDELKALVPVDVRAQGEAPGAGLGNRISFLFASLPVAEPDPVAVLSHIRAQTREAKRGGHAGPLSAIVGAGELLPRRARALAARTVVSLAPFNVIVSNVPGPPVPLFLMGRRVTALLPAIPIVSGHALTIGALSYAGRLGIGLYGDAHTIPDLVTIARDLESALDALRVAAPPVRDEAPAG